jgi:hypothetical protein
MPADSRIASKSVEPIPQDETDIESPLTKAAGGTQSSAPNRRKERPRRPRRRKRWHRLIVTRLIASESLLGLAIASGALLVSVFSLLQSREAGRTAAKAAQARELLMLNIAVHDSPNKSDARLEIKPTSAEFVLSDVQLNFVRLPFDGQYPDKGKTFSTDDLKTSVQTTTEEAVTPESIDMSRLRFAIEYLLEKCSYPHKWRSRDLTNYDTYDLAGYFPILLRVEYVHEGQTTKTDLLYEIFYSGWVSSGPNALPDANDEVGNSDSTQRDEPESSETENPARGLTLSKPRLVRRLEPTEEPRRVLRERFEQWLNEKFSPKQEVDPAISY